MWLATYDSALPVGRRLLWVATGRSRSLFCVLRCRATAAWCNRYHSKMLADLWFMAVHTRDTTS
jgi:hypothetical protein